MMTTPEFTAAVDHYRRRLMTAIAVMVVGLLPVMGGFWAVAAPLRSLADAVCGPGNGWWLTLPVGFGSLFGTVLGGFFGGYWWAARVPGIRCHGCRAVLAADPWLVPTVVTTRHCHRCGVRVLEDPVPPEDPAPQARRELAPAAGGGHQPTPDPEPVPRPGHWPLTVAAFGPAVVFLLLEPCREDLVAALRPWLGADGAVWTLVGLICAPSVIGFVWQCVRQLRYDYGGAPCPHCGKKPTALWPDMPYRGVVCLRCGRKLAAAPDPPEPTQPPAHPPGPLTTVEEFRAAASQPWWRAALEGVGELGWVVVQLLVVLAIFLGTMKATLGFFTDRFGRLGGMVALFVIVWNPLFGLLWEGSFRLSLWLLARRAMRTSRVPCPHCGRGLEDFPEEVTASKCCPHCGGRVLAEPPRPTAARRRGESRPGV
jgi:hypothetical protein